MGAEDAVAIAERVTEQLTGKIDEKVTAAMGGVPEQVTAQVREVLAGMGFDPDEKISRQPTPTITRAGMLALADPTKHNPHSLGAELDGQFETFGSFLRAVVIDQRRGGGSDSRLRYITDDGRLVHDRREMLAAQKQSPNDIRADLSGSELATGGALVPEEYRSELLMLGLQPASIRRLAFQIPMAAAKISLPAIRDTTHASSVFGGVRAYWTKAGGRPTESQPEFANVSLEALGLKLLTDIENELLADSFISAEAMIAQLWAEAIPFFEEQAFIRGTGAGQPMGVLNAGNGALIATTRDTASHLKVADLGLMESRFLPSSRGRGVYMCSPSALADLMTLTNGSVQVWHRDLTQPIPDVLNGRPLIVNEHMSALGTVGDLALFDWKYYLIGDRQALSIDSSAHAKFEDGITVFRGNERLDGRPWLNSAITPAGGGSTLSPFVTVAT